MSLSTLVRITKIEINNIHECKLKSDLPPKQEVTHESYTYVQNKISCCWPLTKFWRTLVMFDHFWDFDRLVKDEAPGEAEITGSRPPFCGLFGFRVYVTSMGCRSMSFTHA